MAIPYQTTKFKSANILAMAIWDPTTKFNSYHISGYTVFLLAIIAVPMDCVHYACTLQQNHELSAHAHVGTCTCKGHR